MIRRGGENMAYYTTFGALQEELRRTAKETGRGLQFPEVIRSLYLEGRLLEENPNHQLPPGFVGEMAPEQFEALVDQISIPVTPGESVVDWVEEGSIIPLLKDIFIIRHPRYTRRYPHRHDYVEIDCVVQGRCTLLFEEEEKVLLEGSLCLIAPGSLHDVEVSDESTVYCIMLRRSTFETTFFSLLSREDALSLFFRTILQDEQSSNYLIFRTEHMEEVRTLLQNALLECFRQDNYANSCSIAYINLLFSVYLRNGEDSPEYYHYQMSSDFYVILQYIRQHYQDLSLGELAKEFHYSKPHLCTLIKQNTGFSFTKLIKRIRISRAEEYLLHTELPVNQIAETVGYNSPDHFSRVFRSEHSCSPQEYRRQHSADNDRFVPFEMK